MREAAQRRRRRPGQGFTLLEAVVALAVFAAVGMALYGVFNTNLISLVRAQDVSRQMPVVRHTMEYLSAINPSQQQDGQLTFDDFDIRWQATLVEPIRHGENAFGNLGPYDVGLYDVRFEVSEGDRAVGSWHLRVVGYQNVRGLPPDLPIF